MLTAIHGNGERYEARDGVDVALLAQFFERFADQAVSVTSRLDYIVTGAVPRPVGMTEHVLTGWARKH